MQLFKSLGKEKELEFNFIIFGLIKANQRKDVVFTFNKIFYLKEN